VTETAETKAASKQQAADDKAASVKTGRQIPILYTITNDHATQSGDLQGLIDDINEECEDEPGFEKLDIASFLALNKETLDADAQARGFSVGSQYTSVAENGEKTRGYHLFAGSVVVAGFRDTTPAKVSK